MVRYRSGSTPILNPVPKIVLGVLETPDAGGRSYESNFVAQDLGPIWMGPKTNTCTPSDGKEYSLTMRISVTKVTMTLSATNHHWV